MKHQTLIKKLNSAGIKFSSVPHGPIFKFQAQGKKEIAEWFFNGNVEDIIQVSVRRQEQKDDLMSDYFVSCYPDTYKEILIRLTRI